MRLIQLTEEGRVELNYMWMPTWLGLNGPVLKRIEDNLKSEVEGTEATEQGLDAIHEKVLDSLAASFPELPGLRDYLDGLKFVRHGGGNEG